MRARWIAVALIVLLTSIVPIASAQTPNAPVRCQAVGEVRFFWHYDCIEPELRRLAALKPDIAKTYSIGESVSGRPIWALEVANFAMRVEGSDRPAFFLDSTHHGNEIQGTEGAMRLAKRLVESYGVDPDATRWVDSFDIYVVPVVNPDGNLLDRRHNTNGVDLNRNYPYEWCQRAASCGSGPGSEPETKAVMAYMLSMPNLDAYVSLHTGTWDYVSPRCSKTDDQERSPTDDEELHLHVFGELENVSGMGVRGASGTGESICWAYDVLEVYSILSEVTVEQNLLFGVQDTTELDGAMKGIYWLLDHTGRFGGVLSMELRAGAPLAVLVENEGLGASGAWRLEADGATIATGESLGRGASTTIELPASATNRGVALRIVYDHLLVDPLKSAPDQGRPREPFATELQVTAQEARAVAGSAADTPAAFGLLVLPVGFAVAFGLRRRL